MTVPHRDKLDVERVLAPFASFPWGEEEPELAEDMVGANLRERMSLPALGELQKVLVVRPVLLTDGECKAGKGLAEPYTASEQELGGYTVSRKDVGTASRAQAIRTIGRSTREDHQCKLLGAV